MRLTFLVLPLLAWVQFTLAQDIDLLTAVARLPKCAVCFNSIQDSNVIRADVFYSKSV
jgi:hypothetical protein